jgi:hypothetical protein
MHGYGGWLLPARVSTANGEITLPNIVVQVRLVRDDNTAWGNWIDENAIVKQSPLGELRLSGAGIRHHLYFGTAPGNHHLAVAATKGGMASLL